MAYHWHKRGKPTTASLISQMTTPKQAQNQTKTQNQNQTQTARIVQPANDPKAAAGSEPAKANGNLAGDDDFERLAMAKAREAMAPRVRESEGPSGPDKAVWSAATTARASEAGLRLPGLYPKPGSKSASKSATYGNGWYRSTGKQGRRPGRNASAALETLWDLIGSRLNAGQTVPVDHLFIAIKSIKTAYKEEGGDLNEWANNLLPIQDKGHATCVLHQLAIQAGSVFMNTETITKV